MLFFIDFSLFKPYNFYINLWEAVFMTTRRNSNLYINKSMKTTVHLQKVLHFIETTITPDFVDSPEVHDFWEVVFLESGEAQVLADGVALPLLAGEVFFHKPGEAHSIKAMGSPVHAFFISFYSSSKMMSLFEGVKLSLSSEEKKLLYKLFDEARRIFQKGSRPTDPKAFVSKSLLPDAPLGAQQLYRIYLEAFLILCAREKEKNITVYDNIEDLEKVIMENILAHMTEHLYDSFSVCQLCTALNYSKTYLSTLFKKHRGVSLMYYYNALKIKEAKKLLAAHSVSETAYKLDFNNPYYFAKVFKKYEGITPSAYRKKHTPS